VADVDATIAAAEQAGAMVQRPAEDQLYGRRIGTIIDPFGVRWMIATHIRDVSQEELDRAAAGFARTGAELGPGRVSASWVGR
jgi:PhnB protein